MNLDNPHTVAKFEKPPLSFQQIINSEKMTVEKLKTFSGFENISEKQAQHIIETLSCFSDIIINHITKPEYHADP